LAERLNKPLGINVYTSFERLNEGTPRHYWRTLERQRNGGNWKL